MSKEKWVAIEDTINLIDDHIEIRNCDARYVCNKLNQQDQEIQELKKQLKYAICYCKNKIDNINNRYPEGAVMSDWFSREYCIYEEILKELQGEKK